MSEHTSLTVSLPESLGDFIQQRVPAGRYPTASDVVEDALGLLREREQTRDSVVAEIRAQIEVGARQADAGQLRDGREVFKDIRQRRASKPSSRLSSRALLRRTSNRSTTSSSSRVPKRPNA